MKHKLCTFISLLALTTFTCTDGDSVLWWPHEPRRHSQDVQRRELQLYVGSRELAIRLVLALHVYMVMKSFDVSYSQKQHADKHDDMPDGVILL